MRTNLKGDCKMTDEEKKQPEGGNWPGMLGIRILVWTLIFSFLGIVLMGN
jgi:hypothetical protein